MIRIVIADDSEFLLKVLKEKVEAPGRIQVVGLARNGKQAIEAVKTLKPDLLVLDCQMPVMDGLECLKRLRDEYPLPSLMFSSLTYEGAEVTIKAMEYGVADFLQKPGEGADAVDGIIGSLIEKIEVVSLQARLKNIKKKYGSLPSKKETLSPGFGLEKRKIDLIAMGSSMGGVQAVLEVIPKLPADIKPIVWVQHMPAQFIESLARRLNAMSSIRVKVGEDGEVIEQGACYLAPGGFQMRVIENNRGKMNLKVQGTERVSSHCPSCNVLFDSVAQCYGRNVLGVILSGMGEDGAKGLEAMHHKGAFVIGQSEESCIVYGMPKMAKARGAVDIELDSSDIAEGIQRVTGLWVPGKR